MARPMPWRVLDLWSWEMWGVSYFIGACDYADAGVLWHDGVRSENCNFEESDSEALKSLWSFWMLSYLIVVLIIVTDR